MIRTRDEDGFGLVELMVAMLVLVIGILGTISTLDNSRDLVGAAERQTAATARAEREIERLRSIPYAQVAQRATATPSADTTTPQAYVPPGTQVVDTVNGVAPQSFSDGRIGGSVHVYVTGVDDPCCAQAVDYKHVVVAVKLTATTQGSRRPTVLSTFIRPRGTS